MLGEGGLLAAQWARMAAYLGLVATGQLGNANLLSQSFGLKLALGDTVSLGFGHGHGPLIKASGPGQGSASE